MTLEKFQQLTGIKGALASGSKDLALIDGTVKFSNGKVEKLLESLN